MRNFGLILAFTALFWCYHSTPSQGCIAIPMDGNDSPVSMSLPEQRAFLYNQGQVEHMVLSVQYQGATREFAWVIPTETRPQADVQGGALFHDLWKVTAMQEPQVARNVETAGAVPPGAAVRVLERKVAGPYDLAILHASSGGGLYKWLRDNGFAVNQGSRQALDEYVQKGWYFVAARIASKKEGKAQEALREGTIAPLHISYRATELSYPLRVTSGNPGMSKMELFVVTDEPPSHAGLAKNTFKLKPWGGKGFKIDGPPTAVNRQGEFPTLRKLIPRGGTLTKYSGVLSDAQRQRDLVFARM